MRQQLRELAEKDYRIYGLREDDFDFILRLTQEFMASRKADLEREKERAMSDYPDPGIHGESISDLAHYTWVNAQFLWQFCLWRLQKMFWG